MSQQARTQTVVGRQRDGTPADPDAPETEDDELESLIRQFVRVSQTDLVSSNRLSSGSELASGRFTIIRVLGEGGMGVVYEARDAERRCSVALKTLVRAGPSELYRFKNEFRLIAGIDHPNLVRLHELFAEGDLWFFTMELVVGETFSQWVRFNGRMQEDRLRAGLHHLCLALSALHQQGRLHRDVKSSNVLVSPEGRLVLLDFGLAIEPEPGGVGQTVVSFAISGTPAYMSPEQAAGMPASAASDCYAVGVLLFEALVGELPFTGRPGEVLAAKQRDDAPPVASHAPEGPPDLAMLCDALLSRDPKRRPDTETILAQLGDKTQVISSNEPLGSAHKLVGRDRELAALRDAYQRTLAGQPVVLVLHGESGIGKSALCDEFLGALRAEGAAVILSGRCREQETVPFKALDALIDQLSRYLRRLPRERAAALLPRDAFALRRLFPVLGRVDSVSEVPVPADFSVQELQRRAFSALGELLARIRDRQPLVVCIDDIHWTDVDSTAVLRHLLVNTRPLSGLLILVHRRAHAESDLLTDLLEAATSNARLCVRELELGPLGPADAARLAQELLGDACVADPKLCSGIARESAGSPFLAGELARLSRGSEYARQEAPSLSSAIMSRVRALPVAAQTALELLALLGRPVEVDLLMSVAQIGPTDLDLLRGAQLVRGRDKVGRRALECYHDTIREVVGAALSDAQKGHHYRALTAFLTAWKDADLELLSTCLENTGDRSAAARYAEEAAEQAASLLAFERAAAQFRRALAIGAHDDWTRCGLLVKLGHSLEHAGQGSAAADAYRQAAALSKGDDNVELRRHAAEQLLATGQLDNGLSLLREVCRDIGFGAPWSDQGALVAYAWNSMRLRFADIERHPRRDVMSARDRLRLRVARTLVSGLIGYLPMQTASNTSRYLRLALECGGPADWIGALGFHAYTQTLIDPEGKHASTLLERMDELAEEDGSAEAHGFASLMKGASAYHRGHFLLAREHLALALRALRSCAGMDWEIDCANIYDQLSASDCGAYRDIARTTPPLIDEAHRRGRVWTATMLSGFGVQAWLVLDNPAGYDIVLAEAKQCWPESSTPRWPDFMLLAGEAQQLIYQGSAATAFERFDRQHVRYVRSGILRSTGKGIGGFVAHHARAAAAALRCGHPQGGDAPHLRTVIRSAVTALRAQGGAKRIAIAGTLEAALHLDRNAVRSAQSNLIASADTFESAGGAMLAAAARRRAGQLLGGPRGAALIARGDAFMKTQGVANLEAMTEVSCPGCAA